MKTNKLLAMCLALVMVMSLGTTAFAATAGDSAHTIKTVIDVSNTTKTENYADNAIVDLLLFTEGENTVKSVRVTSTNGFFDSVFTVPSNAQLPGRTQFNIERRQISTGVYGVYFRTNNALNDSITLHISTELTDTTEPTEPTEPEPKPPVTHVIDTTVDRNISVSNSNMTVNDKTTAILTLSTRADYFVEDIDVTIGGTTKTIHIGDNYLSFNDHTINVSRSTNGSVSLTFNSVTADIAVSAKASNDIYAVQIASVTGVSSTSDYVQFVYHGDSLNVQLTPSSRYTITNVKIASDYDTVTLETDDSSVIKSNFKVSTTENNNGRVTVKLTGITSNVKITAVTDKGSSSKKAYLEKNEGSQTKIEFSEDDYAYIGDTVTVTIKTTNKQYGIRSATLSMDGSSVTIQRNAKSFKIDGTTYYVTWKHSGDYEVMTFTIEATGDIEVTSRSAKLSTLDDLIYNSAATHALTKSVSNKMTVTFSPTTPVPNNEDVKVTITSSDTKYGINTVRVTMGDFSTTVARNATSFKLGGITYKCYWTYSGRFENMTFTIPVTNDLKITANGALLTDLPAFVVTTEEANTRTYAAYMFGYGNSMFGPRDNITRAEAVTMLTNLFLNVSDSTRNAYQYSSTYSDINGTEWYAGAIGYAQTQGYLTVLPNSNTFNPNTAITRSELLALVCSFAGVNTNGASISSLSKYTDVPTSHWAANAIAYCTSINWVQGYGNGQFGPNNNVTRAEAAVMCNNATGRPAMSSSFTNSFVDVTPSDWFYNAVMTAANDIVISVK